MSEIHTTLAHIRRPKLLIRAARSGVQNYRRDTYIRSIPVASNKTGSRLLDALFVEENRLNECRCEGDASYKVQYHIMVLTALLAESTRPETVELEYKMAA